MVHVIPGVYSGGADTVSQPFSSRDERPIHQANLTIGYYIERTEVTNRLFLGFLSTAMTGQRGWPPIALRQGRVLMLYPNKVDPVEPDSIPRVLLDMNDSAIYYDGDRDVMTAPLDQMDNPVVGVSWYGAKSYCENYGLRLPTEHEWEIAAKGDSASFAYPWGNTISSDMANYRDSGYGVLRPRGSYPSSVSQFGLLDLVGNAAEWVKDWYGSYSSDIQTNPEGPIIGTTKVVRGGSYRLSAAGVRVTARADLDPTLTSSVTGFRTAFTDTTSN
jgi:formylglycine-generating enzyme required for sulfatase activity